MGGGYGYFLEPHIAGIDVVNSVEEPENRTLLDYYFDLNKARNPKDNSI